MAINPFSASNIFLVLISAGLALYLGWLWQRIRQSSGATEFKRLRKPVAIFLGLYALYFSGISVLAANGFFTEATMPPRFLVVFLPLLSMVVLFCRAKMNGPLRFLSAVPPSLLIGVQVYRLLIELVFLQFANEKIIPEELSFHGRNLDLVIGVLALPVAFLFHKKHRVARKAGLLFNVLGLLSLVNIFSIAIPSLPSPFRVYDTLYLPTYFPGILIVFLASFAIFLHLLSVRQLMVLKKMEGPKEPGVTKIAENNAFAVGR